MMTNAAGIMEKPALPILNVSMAIASAPMRAVRCVYAVRMLASALTPLREPQATAEQVLKTSTMQSIPMITAVETRPVMVRGHVMPRSMVRAVLTITNVLQVIANAQRVTAARESVLLLTAPPALTMIQVVA